MDTRSMLPLAGLIVLVSVASRADAQTTETVRYYHSDAIGSVRAVTDQSGQVVARYDYWAFGVPAGAAPAGEVVQFAGGERDAETSLYHFGARYADAQSGRFTSPDPITADALRLVSPQRWNRYAYALNNPLRYVDPDGLDALLVNFTDGAGGVGHVGIMALHPDGSGLYGGFAPVNPGLPFDSRGQVKYTFFAPGEIRFDGSGRPTAAALSTVRRRLAVVDGKSADAIRIRHIKTSEADTAALEAHIRRRFEAPGPYVLGLRDCLDFCVRGLWSAGIPAPLPSMVVWGWIPDFYFQSRLLDWVSRLSEWADSQKPRVDTSYCIHGIDCR